MKKIPQAVWDEHQNDGVITPERLWCRREFDGSWSRYNYGGWVRTNSPSVDFILTHAGFPKEFEIVDPDSLKTIEFNGRFYRQLLSGEIEQQKDGVWRDSRDRRYVGPVRTLAILWCKIASF